MLLKIYIANLNPAVSWQCVPNSVWLFSVAPVHGADEVYWILADLCCSAQAPRKEDKHTVHTNMAHRCFKIGKVSLKLISFAFFVLFTAFILFKYYIQMVLDNIIWPGEEEKEDDNGISVAIRCKMAGYLRQFVETGISFFVLSKIYRFYYGTCWKQ